MTFHTIEQIFLNICSSSTSIIKTHKSIADDYKMIDQSTSAQLFAQLHKAANQLRDLSGCSGCRIYTVNAERKTLDCISATGVTLRTWPLRKWPIIAAATC